MTPKPVGPLPRLKTQKAEYECQLCGSIFMARVKDVEAGDTKSCGCLRAMTRAKRKHGLNLAGQTIGYLDVVEEAGISPQQRILWRCFCRYRDCDSEVILSSRQVWKGSCGCWGRKRQQLSYLKKLKESINAAKEDQSADDGANPPSGLEREASP